MGKSKKKKKSDRRKPAPVKHFTQDDVFLALFNGGDPREDEEEEREELPENYRQIWNQMTCFRSIASSWVPLEDLESLERRKELLVAEIRELLRQRLLEREAKKKKLISQARRRAKSDDGAVVAVEEEPEKSQWDALLESLGGLFGHNREVMIAEGLISPDTDEDVRSQDLGRTTAPGGSRGHTHKQISIVTGMEPEDFFGGPETLPGIHSRRETVKGTVGGGSFLTAEDELEAEQQLSDQFRRQPSQVKAISRKPSFSNPSGMSRDMSFSDYGLDVGPGSGGGAGVGVGMGGRERSVSGGIGSTPLDSPEITRARTKSTSKDGSTTSTNTSKHSHAPVTSKANQEAKLLIMTSEDYLPSLWAGLLKKPERAKVAALARFRLAELARKEREEAEAKAVADAAAAQALIEEEERRMLEEKARLEREALEAEAARRLLEEEEGAERARQLLLELQTARDVELTVLAIDEPEESVSEPVVKPKSSKRKKSVKKVTKKKEKTAKAADSSLSPFSIPPSRAETPESSLEYSLAGSSTVVSDEDDDSLALSVDDGKLTQELHLGDQEVPFTLCQTRRLESRGGLATAPTMSSIVQVVNLLVDDWGDKYPDITEVMNARTQPEEGPTMVKPRELILEYILGFNPDVHQHLEWYQQSLRSMFEAGESLDDNFNIQHGFSQAPVGVMSTGDSDTDRNQQDEVMRGIPSIEVVVSRPPTVDASSSRAHSTRKSRDVLRMKSRDMSFRNDTAPSSLDQESLIGLNPRYSPSHTAISADNTVYTRGGSLAGSDIAHSVALANSSVGAYSASLHGSGSYMHASGSPSKFSQNFPPPPVRAYMPAYNSALNELYNFSDDAPLMDKIAADVEIAAVEQHADIMEKLKLSQSQTRDSLPYPRSRSPRRGKAKISAHDPGFAVPLVEPGGVNIFPELLAVSCDYSASGILTMTSLLSRAHADDPVGGAAVSLEHTGVLSFEGVRIPHPSPCKSKHGHFRKQHYQNASVDFNSSSTVTNPLVDQCGNVLVAGDRSSASTEHQKHRGAAEVEPLGESISTVKEGERASTVDQSLSLYEPWHDGVGAESGDRFLEGVAIPSVSHPYARRPRARSKTLSIDDGSDSDSVVSIESYERRKLSLHGVYFDLMSDGEGGDDHSLHTHLTEGTERVALSNDTTLALLQAIDQRKSVQSPVVPFRPKDSFSSQSVQRRKRFVREKSPRALVKTMFTPYPIHKKGYED